MTESLPHLRGHIASLSEFHNLVQALRALAGTHAREAQDALAGASSYLATIEEAISRAAALLPGTAQPAPPPEASQDVLLVVLSEYGFVGGHNERLIDKAREIHRAPERVLVVGRHGKMTATEMGLAHEGGFSMTTQVGGVANLAREINDVLAWASGVRIVFAHRRRGAHIEYVAKTVLPLPQTLTEPSQSAPAPLHHLPPDDLMRRLTSEYLFAEIALALMDGLACENAARLRAMETANRNVEDKLSALRQKERVLNQETITEELMDLATGVEAVMQAGK